MESWSTQDLKQPLLFRAVAQLFDYDRYSQKWLQIYNSAGYAQIIDNQTKPLVFTNIRSKLSPKIVYVPTYLKGIKANREKAWTFTAHKVILIHCFLLTFFLSVTLCYCPFFWFSLCFVHANLRVFYFCAFA